MQQRIIIIMILLFISVFIYADTTDFTIPMEGEIIQDVFVEDSTEAESPEDNQPASQSEIGNTGIYTGALSTDELFISRYISDTNRFPVTEKISYDQFNAHINKKRNFAADHFEVVEIVYTPDGSRNEVVRGEARILRRYSDDTARFRQSCGFLLREEMEVAKIPKYINFGAKPEVFMTFDKWYGGYFGISGYFSFISSSIIPIPFPNLKFEYTHANEGKTQGVFSGLNTKFAISKQIMSLDVLAGYERWEDSLWNRNEDDKPYKDLDEFKLMFKASLDFEWTINNYLQLSMGVFFKEGESEFGGLGVNVFGVNASF